MSPMAGRKLKSILLKMRHSRSSAYQVISVTFRSYTVTKRNLVSYFFAGGWSAAAASAAAICSAVAGGIGGGGSGKIGGTTRLIIRERFPRLIFLLWSTWNLMGADSGGLAAGVLSEMSPAN